MARRSRSNPLALAILCLLQERERHPYDLVATLKNRHKHESIRLNYGSLYSVVDRLEADGLIEAVRSEQDGNRPPRTVYGLTESGKDELVDWLSTLLSTPRREYTHFTAALSLLPSLPPADAVALLRTRLAAIERQLAEDEAGEEFAGRELGLPRLFLIEAHYEHALRRTERDFVAALIDDIEHKDMEGIGLWTHFHESGFSVPPNALPPTNGVWRELDESVRERTGNRPGDDRFRGASSTQPLATPT